MIRKKPSFFNPKKSVKYFMGDKDKDGIMNMFDCAPNNPKKQGPQHEQDIVIGFDHIKSLKTVGDVKALEDNLLRDLKKKRGDFY